MRVYGQLAQEAPVAVERESVTAGSAGSHGSKLATTDMVLVHPNIV